MAGVGREGVRAGSQAQTHPMTNPPEAEYPGTLWQDVLVVGVFFALLVVGIVVGGWLVGRITHS